MLTLLQQVLQPRLRARLRGREVANVMWAMAKVGWDPSVSPRSSQDSNSKQKGSNSGGSSGSGNGSSSDTSPGAQIPQDSLASLGLHDASSCFEQLLRMACDDSHVGALWKLKPQELSNILYSLATAPPPTRTSQPHADSTLSSSEQTTDSRENPSQQRLSHVHALATAFQASFSECEPQALSNAIWALSRLSYFPTQQWMEGFLSCSESQLYDFTDQGLSITVVAMARLRFRPPPAWRYVLLDAVWRLLPRGRSGQATANTLWAMVAMGQAPPDPWVDACLASLADRSSSLSEEDLSNALVAAAKTRRRPSPEALDAMLGRAYDLMPSCSLKAIATIVSALGVLQLRPNGGWMNRLLNCVYKAAGRISSSRDVPASSSGFSSAGTSAGSSAASSAGSPADTPASNLPSSQYNLHPALPGSDGGNAHNEEERAGKHRGGYPVRVRPMPDVGCHAIAAVLKALAALEFKPTRRWLEGVLLVLQRRAETGLLLQIDAEQAVAACEGWGHDPGEPLLRAAHRSP